MVGTASPWLIPPLQGLRLNWLANAEISTLPLAPEKVGLSVYQYDRYEFDEYAKQLPAAVVELDRELRTRFELDPRRWTKIGFRGGERESLSQYFVIDPRNAYPISTLRLGLRLLGERAGCSVNTSVIEPALGPALRAEGTLWALIAKWDNDRPNPRLSCMIQLRLLEATLTALEAAGVTSTSSVGKYLQVAEGFRSSQHVFVSFDPLTDNSVVLDFEPVDENEVPPQCLDLWSIPKVQSGKQRYLKCRLNEHTNELSWTVYRPLSEVIPAEQLNELTKTPSATARRSRQYYDDQNATIVSALGSTYQAGLIGKSSDATQTLRNLSKASGVKAGETVLDLGCGSGGPAIALAEAADGVNVIGITISPRQAASASEYVSASRVRSQVNIIVGDYHDCPVKSESVDRAVFFESLGYAEDIVQVLREAYRCLRPGGEIYIKDVVRKPNPLNAAEALELAEFDRLYAQRTPTPDELARALVVAGFSDLKFEPLSKVMQVTGFFAAMFDTKSSDGLSEFGRHHYRAFRQLPITFAHFSAKKLVPLYKRGTEHCEELLSS